MTLVEMLVSIAILSVMILAFSSIMVQSQQFVTLAQSSRRSHATAASIGRVVRRDLRRASQNGFLAIISDDGNPLMILTAAGVAYSITDGGAQSTGTGSLICYGSCSNNAPNASGSILWRPAYILAGAGTPETDDVLAYDLSELQSNVNVTARTIIDRIKEKCPTDLAVPPEKLEHIEGLWQVLAHGCKHLSIMWTDGTTSTTGSDTGNLNWYGIGYNNNGTSYVNRSSIAGIEDPNESTGSNYYALWTHEDQSNWPQAVKVRFQLQNNDLPKNAFGERAFDFEVICNIGQ